MRPIRRLFCVPGKRQRQLEQGYCEHKELDGLKARAAGPCVAGATPAWMVGPHVKMDSIENHNGKKCHKLRLGCFEWMCSETPRGQMSQVGSCLSRSGAWMNVWAGDLHVKVTATSVDKDEIPEEESNL
jgi:hypothetical protein